MKPRALWRRFKKLNMTSWVERWLHADVSLFRRFCAMNVSEESLSWYERNGERLCTLSTKWWETYEKHPTLRQIVNCITHQRIQGDIDV